MAAAAAAVVVVVVVVGGSINGEGKTNFNTRLLGSINVEGKRLLVRSRAGSSTRTVYTHVDQFAGNCVVFKSGIAPDTSHLFTLH